MRQKEKEIRQGIRLKRKPEQKQKLLPKLEKENVKPYPLKVETNSIDLTDNKKLLHKRLKTIKVEENPVIEYVLNKAKPTVG